MYIVQSDIEEKFGVVYVAQWSAFTGGNTPTVDTGRVTAAITAVEARANSLLSGSPYTVPLQSTGATQDPLLIDALAELAGIWLWRTRGLNTAKETTAAMEKRYCDAMNILRAIRCGHLPIAAVKNGRLNIPFTPSRKGPRRGYCR